eukprot:15002682-Alexandrium_andersonii.AAC.1
MICNPDRPHQDFPCLHGCKAAETRHLAPGVLKLAVEWDTGAPAERHRTLCLKALVSIYRWVDTTDMFPTPAEARALTGHIQNLLAHYSWLARAALEENKYLWSIVPKFHFCHHWGQQAEFMNPRFFWTYMSEDYVGVVIK